MEEGLLAKKVLIAEFFFKINFTEQSSFLVSLGSANGQFLAEMPEPGKLLVVKEFFPLEKIENVVSNNSSSNNNNSSSNSSNSSSTQDAPVPLFSQQFEEFPYVVPSPVTPSSPIKAVVTKPEVEESSAKTTLAKLHANIKELTEKVKKETNQERKLEILDTLNTLTSLYLQLSSVSV